MPRRSQKVVAPPPKFYFATEEDGKIWVEVKDEKGVASGGFDADGNLRTFTLFPKLPKEIQLLIWEFGCYAEQRILPYRLEFGDSLADERLHGCSRDPAILYVSSDSRRAGLKVYEYVHSTYINWSTDFVFSFYPHFHLDLQHPFLSKIVNLAITTKGARSRVEWLGFGAGGVTRFQNLKRVVAIDHVGGDWIDIWASMDGHEWSKLVAIPGLQTPVYTRTMNALAQKVAEHPGVEKTAVFAVKFHNTILSKSMTTKMAEKSKHKGKLLVDEALGQGEGEGPYWETKRRSTTSRLPRAAQYLGTYQ